MTTENHQTRNQAEPLCSLSDAVETLRFWTEMWANQQADIDEPDDSDREERKVIAATNLILRAIPKPEEYVAWLRWNGRTFVACDSDSEGAFKVCRHPYH